MVKNWAFLLLVGAGYSLTSGFLYNSPNSCQGRCNQKYNPSDVCHCNLKCKKYQNCCEDYRIRCSQVLYNSPNSCQGRCNQKYNPSDVCHCNLKCKKYQNCCEDYRIRCSQVLYNSPNSCQGRCKQKYNPSDVCHCNLKCEKYQNCCEDYRIRCSQDSGEMGKASVEGFSSRDDAIDNKDLQQISEQIYQSDSNKAKESDVIINKQYFAKNTKLQEDKSPEKFFTYVNEKTLFSKPTYVSFIKLLDNYQKRVGMAEEFTAEQLQEQDTFLETIMKTEVMKLLYRFLHSKHRYNTKEEFIADLKQMWFGLYSRGNDEGDSSGFEHVFVGEVKKGKVSGFHNWINFYLLEKHDIVNYFSYNYDGAWTSYPDVMGLQFKWQEFYKEVGSAFIGSSPEFEFALYSLCFIARPGKSCHLKIGGHNLQIRTYTWEKSTYGNGKKYVGTAYVESS